MRRQFNAPNSYGANMADWRRDIQLKALGAATCRGGVISGTELAPVLGVSPRALRLLLVNSGFFSVDYETGEAVYKISPATIKINMPLISSRG